MGDNVRLICPTLGCDYESSEYPIDRDAWTCPACDMGHLRIVEGNDIKHADRLESRADRMQDLEDADLRYREQKQEGKNTR